MTTLSDTHLLVLSAAAARDDRLVTKHKRLPGASLQRVCEALAKRGLLALAELDAHAREMLIIATEDGRRGFAITAVGLDAIGGEDVTDDRPRDERLGVDPALIDGSADDEFQPQAPITPALTHSDSVDAVEASTVTPNAAVRA
ncbi:hypothetical protein [Elioraea rosea]|uniref:hypothetical protein n=1 Tax=Elioraea rosea TaxID=2492390 RepID=UPI00118669DF|nr:hypothetical protein [Elioraea rosea]